MGQSFKILKSKKDKMNGMLKVSIYKLIEQEKSLHCQT